MEKTALKKIKLTTREFFNLMGILDILEYKFLPKTNKFLVVISSRNALELGF